MELTLGAAGQLAMVIVHASLSSDGDVPNELRWLVALMVEDPPAVWPPAVIGSVEGDQQVTIRVGGRSIGNVACPPRWRALATRGDRVVLALRSSDKACGRCWFGALELLD